MGRSTGMRRLAVVAAVVTLLAIGARITLGQGLTVGTAMALVLVPSWWPVLRRFWGARVFMAAGAVAALSGAWLTELSSQDHRVSTSSLVSTTLLLVGIIASVGVILWARELMSDARVAAWLGVGLLFQFSLQSELFISNPWKFGFSTGVTVILLAIAQHFRNRWLELAALIALTAASAATDARSSFAILLLSIILTAWQLRPRRITRRGSVARFVIAVTAIGIVVYNVGQTLILDGYLGDAARERSVEQIDTSGSLILGGRPELAATLALMQNQPWGYGAGVLPTLSDITVAKTGMAAIGYQPNNGYVEGYMFGDSFELHSVIGDLWANFGIPGLLLAGTVLVLVARGLSLSIAHGTASAVLIYVAVRGFWNLFFGPIYSSATLLAILVGLVLMRRSAQMSADPSAEAQPGFAVDPAVNEVVRPRRQ